MALYRTIDWSQQFMQQPHGRGFDSLRGALTGGYGVPTLAAPQSATPWHLAAKHQLYDFVVTAIRHAPRPAQRVPIQVIEIKTDASTNGWIRKKDI